ncbi:MAG: hypothetical protein SPK61_04160 [Bacteroidales bacterium]|nr:hypothetical protein [Bacteroidales bacterium]
MKRLKFLIVAVAAFAAHGVWAVTLPGSSYTPYGTDEQYSSQSVVSSGVKVSSGGLVRLGDYDDVYPWTDHCATEYPGPENIMACQNCVYLDWQQCSKACSGDNDCMDWCDEMNYKFQGDCGRSLPLDAPLWFLLVGAVLSVTLRATARRVSQAERRAE